MGCVGDAALAAFVAGRATAQEVEEVEAALDGCADCRARLGERARLAEGRTALRGIPNTLGPELLDPAGDLFAPGPDPWIGKRLGGRYRVLSKLGRGGMGAVYEAEHELIGRRVAIKLLHPEHAARREVLSRFRAEARAAGALGHPGIARALDVGRTEEGAPFLVLELLEGRDLEAVLAEEGPLAVPRAIRLGLEIADAIAAAHSLDIVHRDLKPANVFLTTDDAVKILDFGISKVRGALQTSPDTRSGAILGTPAYMAPEQLGGSADADARSDVYALAAILYRCLAGRLPRDASSLSGLLAAFAVEEVAPITRADVGAELDALLRAALSVDPAARPASMRSLQAALREQAEVAPRTTARPLGDPERRLVIAVVVRGGDLGPAEEAAQDAGAKIVPGARAPTFLFGDGSWAGDLVERAARLAVRLARGPARAVVGPATLVAGELALSAELDALAEDEAGGAGAWIAASLAHARLGTLTREEVAGAHRLRRGAAAAPSPLLGRRAELAQLAEAVETTLADERPAVAFVTAAAGLGKSRLLDAFAEELPPGWRALRCRPREGAADLAVARALLADDAGLPEGDDARLREAALAALMAAADVTGPDSVAAARVLFGLAEGEGGPRLTRDRSRVVAMNLLEGLAARRPLALFVDDAQWADPASVALLGAIVRGFEGPLLVALASREPPPADAGWLHDHDVTRVSPRLLKRGETRRLLAGVLPAERAAAEAERVHAHTGGNPLFVEQIGRALGARDGELPLPPSVEGAVQARLNELAPDLREVLKRGAVFGHPFTRADLAALGVEAAPGDLASLVEAGLLAAHGAEVGEPRFGLAAPVYAEVARRMLGPDARAELHRAAAERLGERAPRADVARHWELGGAVAEAAGEYGRACLEARGRGDLGGALRLGEQALRLAPGDGVGVEVRLAVAEALEVHGRLADQARVLAEAEQRCEGAARAAARTDRAVALQRLGRSAEALPLLVLAREDAERAGDAEALARVLGKHAVALTYAGETAAAQEQLRAAERLVLTKAPGLRADAAIWRGQLASMIGDLGEARNAYWAAVEIYRDLGDRRRAAEASINLADLENRIGAHDEAIFALEAGLEDGRRVGASELMMGYGHANLAYALTQEGRLEEAARALARAEAVAASTSESRLALATAVYRSKHRAAAGELSAALEGADETADRAAEKGLGSLEALARLAGAQHALAAGDAGGAVARAERALALSDELGGMEEDGGALFAVLGDALDAAGRGVDAGRARARGRAVVEASAARIGDRHWRDRFVNDVAAHRALLGGAP